MKTRGISLAGFRGAVGQVFCLWAVVCAPGSLLAEEDLPSRYEAAVTLNLRANIPDREVERPSGKLRGEPLLHWEVPLEDIPKDHLHQSKFLTAGEKRFLFVTREEGGKPRTFVRVFAKPTDTEVIESMNRYGAPQTQFQFIKLVSHNTNFVWDPASPGSEGFQVKFMKGDTTHGMVWAAEQAVTTSDALETVLKENPGKAGMLPERFGAFVGGRTTIVRSWNPAGPPSQPSEVVLPAHGVLGHKPTLTRLAQARKMKMGEEWILGEYLPKFAEFLVELHYRHGIYPELHTQNLNIRMNAGTGEILGFTFQDNTDVMTDPMGRLLQGKSAPMQGMKGVPTGVLNTRHVEDHHGTENVYGNFSGYVGQSVFSWIDFQGLPEEVTGTLAQLAGAQFLTSYLEAVGRETGKAVKLPPDASLAISVLAGQTTDPEQLSSLSDNLAQADPKARNVFLTAMVLQRVKDTQVGMELTEALKNGKAVPGGLLKEIFAKQVDAYLFQTFDRESSETLERSGSLKGGKARYVYVPDVGIVVLTHDGGQTLAPRAIAFDLAPSDVKRIEVALATPPAGENCGPHYSALGQ